MISHYNFKRFLFSLLLLTVLVGLSPISVDAKEATARLVFKKQATRTQDSETYSYTVKKSETLLDILRNELGVKKNRFSIVRRYNPHLTNLDLIHPGQKIFLPMRLRKTVSVEGKEVVSEEPAEQKGAISSGLGLPPVEHLAMMQAILQRMNSSMMTSGRYVIPLPEIGQISIDCGMIPVIEFDDGSVVLMDFKRQMPDNIRRMIRKNWPNYTVVKVDGRQGIMAILASGVNASKSYTMKKSAGPSSYGQKPAVRLPAAWLIARSPASGKPASTQILLTPRTSDGRIPKALVDYLKNNQLIITEIVNDVVLAPLPAEKARAAGASVPRLPSSSRRALVKSLLERLGWPTKTDTDVQIFDAAKDGFNLSIKADVQTRMGERDFLFLSKPLPQQFANILQGRAMEIIQLPSGEPSGVAIEKTLIGLKIPYSTIPYMFPVSQHADLDPVKVIFATLRIETKKQEPLYLVDFDMDPELYSLLTANMGFTIIRY